MLLTAGRLAAQALTQTPQLSTLASLVAAAKLDVPTLQNNATRWTVFAPNNAGVHRCACFLGTRGMAMTARAAPMLLLLLRAAWDAAERALETDFDTLQKDGPVARGTLLIFTNIVDAAALPAASLPGKQLTSVNGAKLSGACAGAQHRPQDMPCLISDARDARLCRAVSGSANQLQVASPGGSANVLVPDIRAGGSVIHITDAVLLPQPLAATRAALRNVTDIAKRGGAAVAPPPQARPAGR